MSQVLNPELARADVVQTWPRMQRKARHDVTIVLSNNPAVDSKPASKELKIDSARISRSADTLVDGWSASMPWVPGSDPDLDRLVNPYSYAWAQVYIGRRLVNTGILYSVENDVNAQGFVKNLEGAATTADLVDSTIEPVDANACFWSNLSIVDWASQIVAKFGIKATLANPTQKALEAFNMIQCSVTDKYGDVINRLAFQRTLLATNDYYGNLLFWAGASTGGPVGTLEEGQPPTTEWKIKFDGRKRFGTYIVYGQDGQGAVIQSKQVDASVPPARTEGVTAGQCGFGNVQVTAAFKRNQQLIQALTIPIPVETWYDPHDSDIWTPNTLVVVKSGKMNIGNGFTFLIRETEHVWEANKHSAVLHVVPPEVYSDAQLQEPWRVA